ncbi:MAG: hypothetical protein MJA29_00475, partial [Candidatus Omnitrophica bacterium]|nr:hypothetical protein [Candidatus Omnitrophota bacterium]
MRKYALTGGFLLLAVVFWLQSTPRFRLEQAAWYVRQGRPAGAVSLCKKIKRRMAAGGSLTRGAPGIEEIDLKLAVLYDRMGLRGAAMQSFYSAVTRDIAVFSRSKVLPETDAEYRGLVLALLENRTMLKALRSFDAPGRALPEELPWSRYAQVAGRLREYSETGEGEYYFRLGDALLEAGLWEEAREFLTRRIVRYHNPVTVLAYLQKRYGSARHRQLRAHIWGERGVYVVLEDFESGDLPVFSPWVRTSMPQVHEHTLVPGAG